MEPLQTLWQPGGAYHGLRLLIFDLDGTLYEDTAHFRYYARLLAERVPPAGRPGYRRDWAAILGGGHAVRVGRLYDRRRDLVLSTGSDLRVGQAWTWDGRPLDRAGIAREYPGPVAPDSHGPVLAMGDLWWPPVACAWHHGAADTGDAYARTKAFMASPAFDLRPVPGLREALAAQRRHRTLVLATNSEPDDVARLLGRLGLTGCFDRIYTETQKPRRSQALFAAIAGEFGMEPQQALSVGDNYLNDIAPARRLGFQTLLIDPHGGEYPADAGPRVSDVAAMVRAIGARQA